MKYKLTYLMAVFLLIIVGCGRENDSQSKMDSTSNQKNSEPTFTTISKQFLGCTLKGENIYKSGSDDFNDLATVTIEKQLFSLENEKHIIHSITVDGSTIPRLHSFTDDGFRIDENEYYAHEKTSVVSSYDVSVTINRQTGFISYSAKGRGLLITANGKCSKVTEKKF